MARLAGFAFAVLLVLAGGPTPDASAQVQKCTIPVADTANPGCGDAYRGMVLYGQTPAPGVPYTWACNQCHSNNPLTDTMNTPAPAPSLIRAAPRDPGYIDFMMHKQPNAEPIIFAMESCCISDRPPDNVMGDLGDLAEFLYTCKIGIEPCVAGGGGGGGGGGTTPGELQGSGSMAFGSKPVGSTSAPLTLTLTNIGSTAVNISGVTSSNTSDFTITANNCKALSQTAFCGITVTFNPSAAGPRSATVTVTSDGVGSPQNFTFTGSGIVGGAPNYEGLWWDSSESGWGINFEHQGNLIFATWFTYDDAGKAWWLVMTAPAGAGNTFTGTFYKTTGSPYNAASFAAGTPVAVGTGTLTFADSGHATFDSIVNGKPQHKAITPQVFGPLPTCTYSATADFATATNYQGLWWNASESGWGINFAHQGDTIFATWFTFDLDGTPLWLVSIMSKGADGTFSGRLLRETATPFAATPFVVNPPADVGSATLTFVNGNNASFKYTIGPTTKTKTLTRQPLGPGGTLCN